MGKHYYTDLKNVYCTEESMTGRLKWNGPEGVATSATLMEATMCLATTPPSTQGAAPLWKVVVVARDILKAAVALKSPGKTNYERMLCYLGSSTTANDKELRGVLKWLVSLRLAEVKVQFPNAVAILDWFARF